MLSTNQILFLFRYLELYALNPSNSIIISDTWNRMVSTNQIPLLFQMTGMVCSPPIKFNRFAMAGAAAVKPSSLQGRSLNISTSYGMDEIVYHHKRQSTKEGWAGYLYSGQTFKFEFDNSKAVSTYYKHILWYSSEHSCLLSS